MTQAKATTIRTALIDELLQSCPEQPTQEDLFGPDGVVNAAWQQR
jgi:hypothetical protein